MARCGWPLLALAVSGVLWGWLWPAMAEHGRAGRPRCGWLWLTVASSGWLAFLGGPGLIDLACTLLRMRAYARGTGSAWCSGMARHMAGHSFHLAGFGLLLLLAMAGRGWRRLAIAGSVWLRLALAC